MSVTDDHWGHAEKNIILGERTNPTFNFCWKIVANNHDDNYQIPPSVLNNPRVEIIEGFKYQQFLKFNRPPSYSLSTALNKALSQSDSRYIVQMDADYFVFKPNWMTDIIYVMKEKNLACFGAPWDPKRSTKWRDFPCSHFTVFDTDKFPKELIDFLPDYPPYFEVLGIHKYLKNEIYRDFLMDRQNGRRQLLKRYKADLNGVIAQQQNLAFNDQKSRDLSVQRQPNELIFSGYEFNYTRRKDFNQTFVKRYENITTHALQTTSRWSEDKIYCEQLIATGHHLKKVIQNTQTYIAEHNLAIDDLNNQLAEIEHSFIYKCGLAAAKILRSIRPGWFKAKLTDFVEWCELGQTADCNVRIYQNARRYKLTSDTLRISTSIEDIKYPKKGMKWQKLKFWVKQLLWEAMPARHRLKVLFRKPGTKQSFPDFALPDFKSFGWEEYFWNGNPFAVHMRSTARRSNRYEKIVREHILYNFLKLADGAPVTRRNLFVKDDKNKKDSTPSAVKIDTSALRSLKNKHAGETVFIIANGPSLNADILSRIEGHQSVACNKIYQLYDQTSWRPSYYFCEDIHVLQNIHNDIRDKIDCPAFYPANPISNFDTRKLFDLPGTYYNNPKNLDFLTSDDIAQSINKGGTVVHSMLQFAFYAGFTKIIIVGLNHSFTMSKDKPAFCFPILRGNPLNESELELFFNNNSYFLLDSIDRGQAKNNTLSHYIDQLDYLGDYITLKSDHSLTTVFKPRSSDETIILSIKDNVADSITKIDSNGQSEDLNAYNIPGVSLVSSGENNHFSKAYRPRHELWGSPNMRLIDRAFSADQHFAKEHAIEIINASAHTKCDIFTRKDLKEILQELND